MLIIIVLWYGIPCESMDCEGWMQWRERNERLRQRKPFANVVGAAVINDGCAVLV